MLMIRKILDLFGYVRTFVIVIVLAAVAGAMNAAEIPPLAIGVVVIALGVISLAAPFGSKYRKNF
jgi:hypothetical protein